MIIFLYFLLLRLVATQGYHIPTPTTAVVEVADHRITTDAWN